MNEDAWGVMMTTSVFCMGLRRGLSSHEFLHVVPFAAAQCHKENRRRCMDDTTINLLPISMTRQQNDFDRFCFNKVSWLGKMTNLSFVARIMTVPIEPMQFKCYNAIVIM